MKPLIFVCYFIFCFNVLIAQKNSCYTQNLNSGKVLYNAGKYADALSDFAAAKECPDVNIKELMQWINKVNVAKNKESNKQKNTTTQSTLSKKNDWQSKYDFVGQFAEGLAEVDLNHKSGYVDKTGRLTISLLYDNAWKFKEGLALVKLNNKFGFIDKMGNKIIDLEYDIAHEFYNGLAAVDKNGKWGYINKTGKEIIDLVYDQVEDFHNETASVKKGEHGFKIDQTGKCVENCIDEQAGIIRQENAPPLETLDTAIATIPFTISSQFDYSFAIVFIKGSYDLHSNFIKINIDSASIYSKSNVEISASTYPKSKVEMPNMKYKKRIAYIIFSLQENLPNGNWITKQESNKIDINTEILPGETININQPSCKIPTTGIPNISNYKMMVTIGQTDWNQGFESEIKTFDLHGTYFKNRADEIKKSTITLSSKVPFTGDLYIDNFYFCKINLIEKNAVQNIEVVNGFHGFIFTNISCSNTKVIKIPGRVDEITISKKLAIRLEADTWFNDEGRRAKAIGIPISVR